ARSSTTPVRKQISPSSSVMLSGSRRTPLGDARRRGRAIGIHPREGVVPRSHQDDGVLMEFHVSRSARDLYQFDQTLFAFKGNVIFADFRAARLFAQKMNERRDLACFPEQSISAGQINAMGLIDEILHAVVFLYRRQANPAVLEQALDWLGQHVGREQVSDAL